MRSLILSLLLSSIAASYASPVFEEQFSAYFLLKSRGAVIGKTSWSLSRPDENNLVYESQSDAAGIAKLISNDHIVETSEWRLREESLQPFAYRYDRSGGRKEKQIAVSFDWENRLARNTAKGQTWSMPLPDGTLDKLGYVLAMMHDLNAGKRDLQYQIADGGRLKTYRLKAIGEESLKTAIGTLPTIKILRLRKDSKRETTFWCAPRLRYLPVKVEHKEKDGSVITLTIESVEGIADSGPAPGRS